MKKLLLIFVAFILTVSSVRFVSNASEIEDEKSFIDSLKNPEFSYYTRDYVFFGSYWQEDTNEDGVADENDTKTPIRWQVLKDDGEEILLMSDKILDYKSYAENGNDISWENSYMREWLNEDFYDVAFSDAEKNVILNTVNNNSITYGASESMPQNDTNDKVFLLSFDELTNPSFGFRKTIANDVFRKAEKTDFVTDKKANFISWASRTVTGIIGKMEEDDYRNHYIIGPDGDIVSNYAKETQTYGDRLYGVRPAIRIKKSGNNYTVDDNRKISVKESEWNTIIFGEYNEEPIVWRVLNINDDKATLLSETVIEEKKFNESGEASNWENSSIREWLNNDFYNAAFTEDEKKSIILTKNINTNKPLYASEENDTDDNVYLLSINDIRDGSMEFPDGLKSLSDFWMIYTENYYEFGDYNSYERWLLRTSGKTDNQVMYINNSGTYAEYDVDYYYSIRPAITIDLTKNAWKIGYKYNSNSGKSFPEGVIAFGDNWILDEEGTLKIKFFDGENNEIPHGPEDPVTSEFVKYSDYIKKVIIDDGFTEIPESSFANLKNLEEIIIPDSVTSIGYTAFKNDVKLKDIDLPASVKQVSWGAFKNTGIMNDNIDENGLVIVNHILIDGSKAVGSVVIPGNVSVLAANCFYSNKKLDSVIIPEGVTDIPPYSFTESSVREVQLPETTRLISSRAFNECGIEKLLIPENVLMIYQAAFARCYNLREVICKAKLFSDESIGSLDYNASMFANCKKMLRVHMDEGTKFISWAMFSQCDNLRYFEVPQSAERIELSAFADCIKLKAVKIENNSITIEDNSFNNCNELCIYCNANSNAEKYAIEHGIKYAPISEYDEVLKELDEEIERELSGEPTVTPTPIVTNVPTSSPTPVPEEKKGNEQDEEQQVTPTNVPTFIPTTIPTSEPTIVPSMEPPVTTVVPSEPSEKQTEEKDNITKFNIKNKAKVKISAKIKVKDEDKIKTITLNGKKIKVKSGKTSIKIKLKTYKKLLKKKGKWNKLVITDIKGNKKTIRFKIK